MILEGAGRMSINSSSNLLHQQPSWTDGYSTCNVSSSFYGTQWHEIHPQYWTKFQVWEWLQHLLDTNQLDANCIPFQEFDINGEHLCSMSLQEFTQAAGTAGQLLYSNLQHLKWNGQCGSDVYQSHNVIVKTEQTDPSLMVSWKEDNYLYDSGYGSTVELLDSKTFCRAQISMMTPSHQ
ncbi:ETS homologous factor, partial [Haliaeetus albicilla]